MMWEQVAGVAALVAAGVVGFLIGDYRGEIALQDLQLQAAVLRAQDGKAAYARLVAAQDQLSAARADRERDARDFARRVRELDADRKRAVSSDACGDERAAVARCERLLKEGAGLVGVGVGLLQRNASIHDALVQTVK